MFYQLVYDFVLLLLTVYVFIFVFSMNGRLQKVETAIAGGGGGGNGSNCCDKIDTLSDALAELGVKLNLLITRVDGVNTAVSTNAAAITNLTSNTNQQIVALQKSTTDSFNNVTVSINSLGARVTNLENYKPGQDLITRVDNLAASVNSFNNSLTDITTKQNSVIASVATLTNSLTTLSSTQTKLVDYDGNITSTVNAIVNRQADFTKLNVLYVRNAGDMFNLSGTSDKKGVANLQAFYDAINVSSAIDPTFAIVVVDDFSLIDTTVLNGEVSAGKAYAFVMKKDATAATWIGVIVCPTFYALVKTYMQFVRGTTTNSTAAITCAKWFSFYIGITLDPQNSLYADKTFVTDSMVGTTNSLNMIIEKTVTFPSAYRDLIRAAAPMGDIGPLEYFSDPTNANTPTLYFVFASNDYRRLRDQYIPVKFPIPGSSESINKECLIAVDYRLDEEITSYVNKLPGLS